MNYYRQISKDFIILLKSFLAIAFFLGSYLISFSQIMVNNNGDGEDFDPGDGVCETGDGNGICTLRAAVQEANALTGADDIVFDNALIGSTISIDGVLLITGTNGDATNIDGDIDGDGDPDITIEPSGSNYNGIEIESSNCVISGLHIQGFSSASYAGIFIDGGDGNEIYGNYLGTDNTGNGSGTANHSGIYINNGATGTIIGDGTSNGMNIIGNNSFGIRIAGASDNTIISGNHIGIGLDGDTDIGNSRGIDVFSTDGTQIGVSGDLVNIISNNSEGIRISGGNNTIIYNNYIGVDVTGVLDRGNGGAGVYFLNGCNGGQVGNTTTNTRNVIAGNSGHGVHVDDSDNITILNNLIGLGSDGDAALGNNHGVRAEGTSSNIQIGNGTAAGRNIISANSTGINVGAGPTYIHGNYIGTDETGLVDRGNGVAGVSLTGGSGEVGGITLGEGNVISGNSFGIGVSVGGFSIMGNYIGTNASGTSAIPNDNQGIRLGVGSGTNIGDGSSNGANLISGNTLEGIIVFNASVTGNTIRGNLIGVQADGVTPLGNNDHGIRIDSDASSNTIWENVIANNGDATGEVGISVDGSSTTGNLLTENLIYDNFDGGISLSGSAHGSIAAPVISSTLDGDIEGTSISGATIEVYADAGSQGEQFLGTTTASGTSWSISIDPGTISSELTNISVIQIDGGNNTSAFSSSPLIQSYVVSNTNDSGEGSLRWCIANANASASKETISFNIPGSAPWQIDLQTELLIDNNDNLGVEIDGLTQPNSSFGGDMITLDGTSFSTLVGISIEEPDVEIYGLHITGFADGIETVAGSDNVIIGAPGRGNVISGNTSEGLRINGGTNGLVQGNRIGTSIDGLSADGNGDYGIHVQNSDGIQIGGNRLIGEGNVISGNGSNGEFAIRIRPSDNVGIFGNLIGTDLNGDNDMGNAGGISIEEDCDNAIIGGFGTGQGNVISGCFSTAAIRATTFAAAGNNGLTIENNIIGLNLDGDTPIGNANRGISVSIGSGSSPDYVIRGNTITATSIPLEISNLVGNVLIDGNYIGTDINGNTGIGFENSGDGINITDSHGSNTTDERIQIINNVIVNSSDQGIELIDAGAGVYDVLLQGNIIGEDVSGTAAGNGGSGIRIGTDASNLEIGGEGNENIFSNNTEAGILFDGLAAQPAGSIIGINSYYCNGTDGIDFTLTPIADAPVITMVNTNFISGTSAAADGSVVHIYEINADCADNQGASYVGQATMSSGNWNLDGTFTATNYFVATVTDIVSQGISKFSISATVNPFIVTNTNDSGVGSLRWCMTNAIASPTRATILFDLPGDGSGNSWLIQPLTRLPDIDNDPIGMIIDGTSQPGWDMDAGLMPHIDGVNVPLPVADGLRVNADFVEIYGMHITGFLRSGIFSYDLGGMDNSAIGAPNKGNVISGNDAGIILWQANNTVIQGNRIGTTPDGLSGNGNGFIGIYLAFLNNGGGVQIGGDRNLGEGNLISNNGISEDATSVSGVPSGKYGVLIGDGAVNVQVYGNLIGTDINGENNLGNRSGIIVANGVNNNITIGSPASGYENVIAGSYDLPNLYIGSSSDNIDAQNNIIGLNLAGDTPIGSANANLEGVLLQAGSGDTNISLINNIIAGHTGDGIHINGQSAFIVEGNSIGVGLDGNTPIPNDGHGISISDATTSVTIGGSGVENIIANNTGSGIYFENMADDNGNDILRNTYYCNSVKGIEFELTPTVDFPHIASITVGGISGTTTAQDGSSVDIYQVNEACNDRQGYSHIATVSASSGTWSYAGSIDITEKYVTIVDDISNGTSEFSLSDIIIGGVFEQDYNAIVALYNSTDGANWIENTNWLSGNNVSSWNGVGVNDFRVETLRLGDNNLVGSIPTEIGLLTKVWDIEFGGNQLSGTIPSSIGDLTELTELTLWNNQLTGSIPTEIGNLTNLSMLNLDRNQLTGNIPTSIGNLANLETLTIWDNDISGTIPVEIGDITPLIEFEAHNNQLTGSIPSEIGNLVNLELLWLWNNQLDGSLPPTIGNLSNLRELNIDGNAFTGSIPSEIANLSNLEKIGLHNNALTGSIPAGIGDLSNLLELKLNDNQLSGSIPVELGNLTNLLILNLGTNQLTGFVPIELGSLTNLESFDIDNNMLTGTIPSELGNLTQLSVFQLDNNLLSGSIPSELGNLTQLTDMQLAGNELSGSLPASFSNLTRLSKLEIEFNQLSGLPDLSSIVSLTAFDVNDNALEFDDLEPNISVLNNYSPQANVPAVADVSLDQGDQLDVTIPVGGSANQYQWFRDGSPISGQTSENLLISNISSTDAGTYHLEVTNTLVTGLTISSNPFEVTVADDNQPPTVLYIFYLDENSPNGTVIGSIEGSDPDGDDLSYSIISGNTNDAFDILNNGDLVVNDETALDFEVTPSFNLMVEVSDGLGGVTSVDITVNLNDIDENVLGLKEKIIGLRLYPNPADEVLTVEMKNGAMGSPHVELYSLNGQKQPLRLIRQSANLIKLDVSTLAPGVYRIVIAFEDHVLSENIVVR